MCGLVGIFTQGATNDKELSLFKGLLLVDQIRGEHATGVIKVDPKKNEVTTIKRAVNAVDFLAEQEVKDFLEKDKTNIYIGHNRYATMGDKGKHENAHPFQHEHITMVHNGGVDPMALDRLEGYSDKDVEVDSHMVCMTIAKHGIKKAVEEYLAGAYALIWWDSKRRSLNFIRNADRPLYIAVTTTGAMVWASEKGMLDVFLERDGRASGYRAKPFLIAKDTHIEVEFSENGIRKGTGPTETPMVFFETDYPVYYGSARKDWWENNSTAKPTARGNVGAASESADVTHLNNVMRINDNLKADGFRHRFGSVLTARVDKVEPYNNMPKYGKIEGTCMETNAPVVVWGVSMEDCEGVSMIRGTVKDYYGVYQGAVAKKTIVLNYVGLSCHDPKYSASRSGYFRNSADPKPSTTSHGSSSTVTKTEDILEKGRGAISQSDDAKIAAAKIVEMNANKGNNVRVRARTNPVVINYPLKVHGHTFVDVSSFREFVARGCSQCGKIPTGYDVKNVNLTIYEGNNFNGLLEDCEFICGACSE